MWDRSPTASDEPADKATEAATPTPAPPVARPVMPDAEVTQVASAPAPGATSAPVFSPASIAPPAPTAAPAPAPLLPRQVPVRPAATPSSPALGSPQAPRATTRPFSSIGSAPAANPLIPPAPAPAAPNVLAPPAQNVPAAGAIARIDSTQKIVEPKKRRMWPFLLLALFTIAGSGLVSWFVANSVDNEPAVATESASPEQDTADSSASALPAIVDEGTTSTTPATTSQSTSSRALEDEPFAQAAEIIRPSVVQLNLGTGLGTGIIIDTDGTILTAAHVVGTATDVSVTFADGSSADGEVIGTHVPTDVAVVKVDGTGRNLVPAALADGNNVRVGQLAVAVGSPFGFDQTVTAGIISAVDRVVPGSPASFVQTDAPINPGNSGGPLINLDGEVVGINDLIFTESGSSAGVGFAISIDLAVIIADQLIEGIEPQVALLGVSTAQPANGERGAQVAEIVDGSAAQEAGLEVGDIIISLGGVDTRGTGDLRAQVIDEAPGSSLPITVLRDGVELELTAVLGSTG